MSHQTKLRVQIKNLNTLKETLEELGYSYSENGILTDYRDKNLGKVDLLVKVGSHSNRVGFKFDAKEEMYDLVGDFYQTSVNEQTFRNAVKKTYVAKEVKVLLRRKRYTVLNEEVVKGGAVKIRARAMAA